VSKRILHICTSDHAGGAAKAVYRIHRALLGQGFASQLLVLKKKHDDPTVIPFQPSNNPLPRLWGRLRRRRIILDLNAYRPQVFFSDDRSEFPSLINQLPDADLINLHWISGFVDYRSFLPRAAEQAPLVWRLADMNPFTGGCHYDEGCGRFVRQCGACPLLGSTREHDLSREVWLRKQQAIGEIPTARMHLIAQSRWIATCIASSSLLGRFPTVIIPNGVNTELFRPRPRQAIQAALNIPAGSQVLLAVADEPRDRRKGMSFVLSALPQLREQRIFFITVGRQSLPAVDGVPSLHLGEISNPLLLSLIYAAADLFVCPSLQDNFPNTVLESMACGTPVVGFDAGGIPDMVRSGMDGLLAPVADGDALTAAIQQLLKDDHLRQRMGQSARLRVEQEFTLALQAKRYTELYRSILQAPPVSLQTGDR
jgi:glycosyltransferase involved in cell wall biosynthesis